MHTLFVVGHGSRESIEVFEIDTRPATPILTWVGCAIAPEPIGLNSVRGLPDGGFIATNFLARNISPEARERMLGGEKNGELWEWHTGSGWKKVPGSEAAGANGIEISNDGKWYYVAAWGSQSFFRLSRSGGRARCATKSASGFRVDNIRWASDGSLLAAGQTGSRDGAGNLLGDREDQSRHAGRARGVPPSRRRRVPRRHRRRGGRATISGSAPT